MLILKSVGRDMCKVGQIAMALTTLTISACDRANVRAPHYVTEASVGGDTLTNTELQQLSARARLGDAHAAFRIAVHYESDPTQEAEAIEWLTVAAGLRYDIATQHLIVILIGRGSARDCEEARLWAHRLDERVRDPESRTSLDVDGLLNASDRCARNGDLGR